MLDVLVVISAALVPCSLVGEGDPPDEFSAFLASAGDFDGDGVDDVLISDPVDADRSTNRGHVWLLSGRTFVVLREWRGRPRERLGSSIGAAGDLDGDGILDYCLGTASPNNGNCARAKLVSGRTGEELFGIDAFPPEQPHPHAGPTFASLGDVDGDRTPDFAIGSALDVTRRRSGWYLPVSGQVTAHSGKDGRALWRVIGDEPCTWFGRTLTMSGDLDGDGANDLAVCATAEDGSSGYVEILSGRSGRSIRRIAGPNCEGLSMSSGSDLDGDGSWDLVVATHEGLGRRAVAYSGKSGAAIREWYLAADCMHSLRVAIIPDCDGDARPDVVVTAPGSYGDDSRFAVFSGARSDRCFEIAREAGTSTNFACSVLAVADRNGDGVGELLVGEASWRHHGWQGEACVYSGRNGKLLDSLTRAKLTRRAR